MLYFLACACSLHNSETIIHLHFNLSTRFKGGGRVEPPNPLSGYASGFMTMYFSVAKFLNFQIGVCAHLGHMTQITLAHNPTRCTCRYVTNNCLCSIAKAYNCRCFFWHLCGTLSRLHAIFCPNEYYV